jgi:transcription elongation factor GreB
MTTKNYITPQGAEKLKNELRHLRDVERPQVVKVVAWAASNGDRSENADYIYGKRRLREIDRRIEFLTRRLISIEVVDPIRQKGEVIRFGASVTVMTEAEVEKKYSIVGEDESDATKNLISWVSPIAKALLNRTVGDVVTVKTPKGDEDLEIVAVSYRSID